MSARGPSETVASIAFRPLLGAQQTSCLARPFDHRTSTRNDRGERYAVSGFYGSRLGSPLLSALHRQAPGMHKTGGPSPSASHPSVTSQSNPPMVLWLNLARVWFDRALIPSISPHTGCPATASDRACPNRRPAELNHQTTCVIRGRLWP